MHVKFLNAKNSFVKVISYCGSFRTTEDEPSGLYISSASLTEHQPSFKISVVETGPATKESDWILTIGLCHRYHSTADLPGQTQGSVGWEMIGSQRYTDHQGM